MPTDLKTAWDAVHDAKPPEWFVGRPSCDLGASSGGSQALPSSFAIEPSGVSSSVSLGASRPARGRNPHLVGLPYRFLVLSGKGGDEKSSWTLPRKDAARSESRAASAVATTISPISVSYPSPRPSLRHRPWPTFASITYLACPLSRPLRSSR